MLEAAHQRVATLAVGVADLSDTLLRAFERLDGGDLDRGKGAVVEVALDARQCANQIAVADHEADAPAGHVVALRERKELDGDIFRAGNLHHGGRAVAIEDEIGIGEVVEEIDLLGAAEGNDALEKCTIDGLGGGIRREVEQQHLRPRMHGWQFVLQAIEEAGGIIHLDGDHMRAGDGRPIDMDGIAGVGDEDGVLLVERGEAEVSDALLGADSDDGLGIGIELDAVATLVPVGDCLAQARNAFRKRVAMRGIARSRFDELGDDMGRRGAVGVPHAEIDDVFAAAARLCLHVAGGVEDVRRQRGKAAKGFQGILLRSIVPDCRPQDAW